jgi:inward rectifier potassium channel
MTMGWSRLFASYGLFFILFNLAFAAAYAFEPAGIANLNPEGYWGRFFFSVETLATVGYGDMHPQTPFTHIVASVEIFTGMMSVALVTGMMFARFSRPTARILFARDGVIRSLDGHPTLMLRAANARQNVIIAATAQLTLIREEHTQEGSHIRRIHDLALRRRDQPIFLFGWNIQHVMDASSPLSGSTAESLGSTTDFLVLTITGTDEITGQTLTARQDYPLPKLKWNYTFADILSTGKDGIDRFDYTRFHDVEPLE